MKKLDFNTTANSNGIDLKCPHHKQSSLRWESDRLVCTKPSCIHNQYKDAFTVENGAPYIISNYYCDTVCSKNPTAYYVERSKNYVQAIKKKLVIKNKTSIKNSLKFLNRLLLNSNKPKILIIGSAEIGVGTDQFLSNPDVKTLGLDIYKTETVDIIADAHYLPFDECTFDGVWIQAVLEHVIDPKLVSDEIHRVLKLKGIVYSEIPFMQPVHEGAYDFTRYTLPGHRYLFKKFEEIECGVLDGPSEAFIWALKYWLMATLRSRLIANIISQSIYRLILLPLSLVTERRKNLDFFSGSYFLGEKSLAELTQSEVIAVYSRR